MIKSGFLFNWIYLVKMDKMYTCLKFNYKSPNYSQPTYKNYKEINGNGLLLILIIQLKEINL